MDWNCLGRGSSIVNYDKDCSPLDNKKDQKKETSRQFFNFRNSQQNFEHPMDYSGVRFIELHIY